MREGARGINDYLSLMAAQGSSAMKQMISKEKRAQIIAALKDNPNATQIAQEIGGVSHTTVGKIAKAAGIALAAAEYGKRLSAEKRTQIVDALKANPNAAEVAKQIGGVTPVGVWKIAKAAGIELTAGKAARNRVIGHRRKLRDVVGDRTSERAPAKSGALNSRKKGGRSRPN